MSQWNIKASSLFILSCVIFLMLLIVVLPDVDLPDTAFHCGTAPVVVHSAATSGAVAVTVAAIVQVPDSDQTSRAMHDWGAPVAVTDPNFRPILFRSIRR